MAAGTTMRFLPFAVATAWLHAHPPRVRSAIHCLSCAEEGRDRLAERVVKALSASETGSPWLTSTPVGEALRGEGGSREVSAAAYASILMSLKRRREWRASVDTLVHALVHEPPGKLNTHHFAMGISTCGVARKSRAALRLLGEMELRSSISPDLVCFNAALSACATCGECEAALHVLRHAIPEAGLQPDAYSYSAAFTALARSGDSGQADEAAALLKEQEGAGLTPLRIRAASARTASRYCHVWRRYVRRQRGPAVGADAGAL